MTAPTDKSLQKSDDIPGNDPIGRRTYLGMIASSSLASIAGCTDLSSSLFGESATILAPDEALVDERIEVSVTGIESDEPVWVEAHTKDGTTQSWLGRGLFESEGQIDLSDDVPLAGTYEEPKQMGLFWSMQPKHLNRSFYDTDQRTQSVTLRVLPDEPDATPITKTTVDRHLVHPKVGKQISRIRSWELSSNHPPMVPHRVLSWSTVPLVIEPLHLLASSPITDSPSSRSSISHRTMMSYPTPSLRFLLSMPTEL